MLSPILVIALISPGCQIVDPLPPAINNPFMIATEEPKQKIPLIWGLTNSTICAIIVVKELITIHFHLAIMPSTLVRLWARLT